MDRITISIFALEKVQITSWPMCCPVQSQLSVPALTGMLIVLTSTNRWYAVGTELYKLGKDDIWGN